MNSFPAVLCSQMKFHQFQVICYFSELQRLVDSLLSVALTINTALFFRSCELSSQDYTSSVPTDYSLSELLQLFFPHTLYT